MEFYKLLKTNAKTIDITNFESIRQSKLPEIRYGTTIDVADQIDIPEYKFYLKVH